MRAHRGPEEAGTEVLRGLFGMVASDMGLGTREESGRHCTMFHQNINREAATTLLTVDQKAEKSSKPASTSICPEYNSSQFKEDKEKSQAFQRRII